LEELVYALAHGTDIDDKDDVFKRIDIHDAALNGKMDVIIVLLDQGATVVDRDYNGSTALCLAAIAGNTKVVTLLLEQGAKINKKNINDITALHIAAGCGHKEMVAILWSTGLRLRISIRRA